MFTKYKIDIKGLELFRFNIDGDLYRLPYTEGTRSYGFRLIKMQYSNRWRIRDQWYSKRQLRDKLILDDSPVMIYSTKETPW